MDNKKLLRLARLRRVAAQADLPFDLMRFTDDREYAADCLARLMDSSNEELLVLCLEVKADLFPPAPAPAPAMAPPAPAPKAAERGAVDQRYVGRLR